MLHLKKKFCLILKEEKCLVEMIVEIYCLAFDGETEPFQRPGNRYRIIFHVTAIPLHAWTGT